MLACVFGQLLATYPSGLTSTLAVSTGCSRNPRKSKAPSVHTNVSSPTRSTRSPSKVLYCDAGRDMYARSDRPPSTSFTSTTPTLVAEKTACLPSRRRNWTTASGKESSGSAGRQSTGSDVDAPDACSTARATVVGCAGLRLTRRPIPIDAFEGEGDAARRAGRAAVAVRGTAMPDTTRPDAISRTPPPLRAVARQIDATGGEFLFVPIPRRYAANEQVWKKLIERGTRFAFAVRG